MVHLDMAIAMANTANFTTTSLAKNYYNTMCKKWTLFPTGSYGGSNFFLFFCASKTRSFLYMLPILENLINNKII